MFTTVLSSSKLRIASIGAAGTLLAIILFPSALAQAAQNTTTATPHATVTGNDASNALSQIGGMLESSRSIAVTSDSHSALKAAVSNATLLAPKHATDGVVLSGGGDQLSIQLPNASQAATAQTVANGVVAYGGTNGSANVVQATSNGVRMLTVINSPNAPTAYDYKISVPHGGKIELTSDGGAVVRNAKGTVIAMVAAPWAADATGKVIRTFFTTDGQTLTQHITHTVPGVVYPVIADPWLSWGWNLYVNFTPSETSAIKHYQKAGYFGWGLAAYICSKVPYTSAEAACTVATLYEGAQLAWAVRNASETNSCLQLAVPYTTLSNPWFYWYLTHWGWTRC